jgi:hypothetical protein
MTDEPVSDSGLGRVDHLFELLTRIETDTPQKLNPYLQVLHGNLELRSLAEQVIDVLLAQDPARYNIYRSVQIQSRRSTAEDDTQDAHRLLGLFIAKWNELEMLVRRHSLSDGFAQPMVTMLRELAATELFDKPLLAQIDQLRRDRNQIVHGQMQPDNAYLEDAIERLESVIDQIRRNYPEQQ